MSSHHFMLEVPEIDSFNKGIGSKGRRLKKNRFRLGWGRQFWIIASREWEIDSVRNRKFFCLLKFGHLCLLLSNRIIFLVWGEYILTLVCTKLWYYFNRYIYGAIFNPTCTKEPNPCHESHYLRLRTYDRMHCLTLDRCYGADLLNKQ